MINFYNQPKLSEHAADKSYNERRLALIPLIESYLSSHKRFGGNINVTFAHGGVSSLVSIINTGENKFVLKIPLNAKSAAGEAQFLKVWEEVGVKVPHVFEDGMLNNHSYVLMDFIGAPVLSDIYSARELEERGVAKQMGQILRHMHSPKTKGFGLVVEGRAQFERFDDWIMDKDMEERIIFSKEHNLLSAEHGSIDKAREILRTHVARNTASSYCHDDFGSANIFSTDPLTVFDPNPRFNNNYLDLGRSVTIQLSFGIFPKQMIGGYFENESYDERVLHASVLLNTYMKFKYWYKVNKQDQILKMQSYLSQNRGLLANKD